MPLKSYSIDEEYIMMRAFLGKRLYDANLNERIQFERVNN